MIDAQCDYPLTKIASNEEMKMVLMRPNYLAISAWLEHIPFAFWLTYRLRPKTFVELGTHYGCSYFAFCQAIERLSIGTACYAVDNWRGDEHAGFYGEEVFAAVSTHNNALYSRFSRIVRAPFEETAEYFEDGSIDLLHLDGMHSYEAVKRDISIWKPKLSNNSLLLLHDTNVRERGFGVHTVLRELRQHYPVFEFTHGHGLGVVATGEVRDPGIRALFEIESRADERRDFSELFARLGRACADQQMADRLQKTARVGAAMLTSKVES